MSAKPAVRRSQAQKDLAAAAGHYFAEGGSALEIRFIDAVQAALGRLSTHPGIGSPKYAEILSMPGLRVWRMTRFPYLVFYVEREDALDVLRILNEQRDIPARFAGPLD
jgi:toxin ParE1/3/4